MCQQWIVIVPLGLLIFSCKQQTLYLNVQDAEANIPSVTHLPVVHGLETADERLLAGKQKQGTIQIRA